MFMWLILQIFACRFRQSGELNPPEVFDYAPYNYSYIGFHVAGVRGLSMLSSRDEGLNLFVSLEWAGQVYRTDTVRDWNGEPIDYTIYFQVFCISTRPQVRPSVCPLLFQSRACVHCIAAFCIRWKISSGTHTSVSSFGMNPVAGTMT